MDDLLLNDKTMTTSNNDNCSRISNTSSSVPFIDRNAIESTTTIVSLDVQNNSNIYILVEN